MLLFLLSTLASLVSLVFCAVAVKRLYAYITRYRFDESVYTLLFGFVHLHYFVWGYIFMTLLLAMLGLFFAFSFLTP